MKILFLTKRFFPDVGGVEKHVFEISKILASRGHKITIICEDSSKKSPQGKTNYHSELSSDKASDISKQPVKSIQTVNLDKYKVRVIRISVGEDNWFKKFRIWREMLANLKEIRNADIIHCHDVFFWYLPFRFFFVRKRVFTTFHGYESYPIRKKAILIRKISEILSSGSICVGEFMKTWYFANPNAIIYGGVNLTKSEKVKNAKTALFFGRLDEQTGIKMYARAAEIIKEKVKDFRLIVVGSGKYENSLKIKTSPFDPEIDKKIKNYRFIFVSRYLSILEALAQRRLVFAVYDNPLKKDYLMKTPFKDFIVIANNHKDLASKVQFYYSNKKLEQEKIEAGYAFAKSQSWERVVEVYLNLWAKG